MMIGLTRREEELFVAICHDGLPNKLVARKLELAPKTVDKHRRELYRKLGVKNTYELFLYAAKNDLLPGNDVASRLRAIDEELRQLNAAVGMLVSFFSTSVPKRTEDECL